MLNAPSPRAPAIGIVIAIALALVPALLASLPWPARAQSPIDWQLGDFAGQPNQRTALTVRVRLDDHPCLMQVDTGVDAAVTWHGGAVSGKKTVDVTVSFAGHNVAVPTAQDKARQLAQCGENDIAGTLGNAFFDGGTLAVDLKNARLTYTPGGRLAARLDAQPMFYARWSPQGGFPLVEMRKAGALQGYALLDTGSTAIGFGALTKEQWDATTNAAPLRATSGVKAFGVPSWGHMLPCFATPSAVPLQAGTWALAAPQVTYCPTLGFTPPIKLEGVMGLRGLGDATVTIDYVSGRWLVEKPH